MEDSNVWLITVTIEVIKEFITELETCGAIEWGSFTISNNFTPNKSLCVNAQYLVDQFLYKLQEQVRKTKNAFQHESFSSESQCDHSSDDTFKNNQEDLKRDSLEDECNMPIQNLTQSATIAKNDNTLETDHSYTSYISPTVIQYSTIQITDNQCHIIANNLPISPIKNDEKVSGNIVEGSCQMQVDDCQMPVDNSCQLPVDDGCQMPGNDDCHMPGNDDCQISVDCQLPVDDSCQLPHNDCQMPVDEELSSDGARSSSQYQTIKEEHLKDRQYQNETNKSIAFTDNIEQPIGSTNCDKLLNSFELKNIKGTCSRCNTEYEISPTNKEQKISTLCVQCSRENSSIEKPSESTINTSNSTSPKPKSILKSILRSPDASTTSKRNNTSQTTKLKSKSTETNSSKKHSCLICGRTFSMWKHLSIHNNKVHLDEDQDQESNSGLASGSLEVLANNSLPVYCCKTCNMTCLSPQSFNTHLCRLPTDDQSNNALSNRILITNILKLHQMRKFVCEVCGLEYRNFKHITYHLPRCVAGPYPCNICFVMFDTKPLLNYHKKKLHKGKKCFVCDECGKSFERRTSLRKHEVNWHESGNALGPFKCDLCPKKFIKRIYLTNHKLRMHSLNKKFLCQVCGNRFMSQNSLMAHMIIHADTNRFECNYCKKQFKRKDKLIHHERLHTGERPFLCQLCGSGFVSKCKLSAHINRHRGDRRFRCPHCTKSYAANWDLKQHIKKNHNKELPKDPIKNQNAIPENYTQLRQIEQADVQATSNIPHQLESKKESIMNRLEIDQEKSNHSINNEEQNINERNENLVESAQYMTVGNGITIPVVTTPVQPQLSSIGHVVQVSGSSVAIQGINPTTAPGNSLMEPLQTIQTIPATEYSVQNIQPPTLHPTHGYIFAQGFDMVAGTIHY